MSDSVGKSVLDHLVIGAQNLVTGGEWFAREFESDIAVGGKHPNMSTHNLLSSISDNSFLEIIAIDPDAPAPACARWFSLDSASVQQQIALSPKLLTWVVGTSHLDHSIESLRSLGYNVGDATELQRGDLKWRLSVPVDGELVENGVIPSLIEWPPGTHPASRMNSNGLRIQELTLHHPEPEKITQALRLIGAEDLATVEASAQDMPSLSVTIDSPVGQRHIS